MKCSISEFWPEQDTTMGVVRRWRSTGVGIGRFFQPKPAKELALWTKCKNEALHGLIHEGQNSTKMQKVAEE